MTSKQMIKYLQDNGFNIVSQKATSHVKLYNPETKRTVIVPMHGKDLKKGLEHSILKQAGLK
jgi:predicted RNA binding protein YcfA (HicA-like mRNA interferase family)